MRTQYHAYSQTGLMALISIVDRFDSAGGAGDDPDTLAKVVNIQQGDVTSGDWFVTVDGPMGMHEELKASWPTRADLNTSIFFLVPGDVFLRNQNYYRVIGKFTYTEPGGSELPSPMVITQLWLEGLRMWSNQITPFARQDDNHWKMKNDELVRFIDPEEARRIKLTK